MAAIKTDTFNQCKKSNIEALKSLNVEDQQRFSKNGLECKNPAPPTSHA